MKAAGVGYPAAGAAFSSCLKAIWAARSTSAILFKLSLGGQMNASLLRLGIHPGVVGSRNEQRRADWRRLAARVAHSRCRLPQGKSHSATLPVWATLGPLEPFQSRAGSLSYRCSKTSLSTTASL
jgi:hypothetical protein